MMRSIGHRVGAALVVGLIGATANGQSPAGETAEHPLKAAIKLAEQSSEAAGKLNDYRALFTKRELVRGRMYTSQMQMKFRLEPFSVYLRFVNPEHAGREVLYVDGRNNGQMLAHDTGLKALVGTVALDPTSDMALAEARHPVTRIGIENMAKGIAQQWEKESAFGECEVKYYPKAKLGERPVMVIESSHPTRRNQFRFAVTRLWIDEAAKLPVRVQQYDFAAAAGGQPILVEDYAYTNIEPNVDLTEADFDVKNPGYQF